MNEASVSQGGSDPIVDLVHRIVSGEPAAEAELVQRFSRALSFLLRRLTRDVAAMKTGLQQTASKTAQSG